ncbi:hypothetical protein GmHk_19G054057 [Glycine max]|nr:hypothetical protein GmHk_19G054057 [Glycine max]
MQFRRHKNLNFLWCSAFILFSDFSQFKSLNFFVFFGMFYVEKVEKHINIAIFISRTSWVQVRSHKSLNFLWYSAFILFSDFSQYKSLNFFVFFWHVVCREEKVEKHIKVTIFISKTSWVQVRLFPLFLCLHVCFLCFFVSPSSFFVPLHSSSFIFCFLCFFVSPTSIFVHLHSSSYSVEGDTKAAIFNSENLQFLSDFFYLKQDSFLCFSIYKFVFFIFYLTFVFVLVPFLFMSLHVDCFL